ncbi:MULTISPECIES: DUF2971 domain-containing protein [unclassified Psychrobacter]|uniref:DUF2971 domain-containing protein n=1 Tax=unclassified Psychrobacter TaxID=196806 RepID=UPI003FD587EA
MLVKYLGTTINERNEHIPRSEFLENGLFRMTQPIFLNDKGSEARFYPYLNEFSPADLAYARKCSNSFNTGSRTKQVADEDLIRLHLEPSGDHYTLENTPTLLGFTDYASKEEYYEAKSIELKKSVEEFNNSILEAISSHIGIFSLSKSVDNEKMWVHYANNHMGLAVEFKEEHSFFQDFRVQDISYKREDRASITYYKNTIRINGEPLRNLELNEPINLLSLYNFISQQKDKLSGITKKLLYTKNGKWSEEQEKRLICPLEVCEEKKGKVITPKLNENIPDYLLEEFSSYHEICLKKIPFDALESIVFGVSVNEFQQQNIIEKARKNPDLRHLTFSQAKFDIFGDINIVDL